VSARSWINLDEAVVKHAEALAQASGEPVEAAAERALVRHARDQNCSWAEIAELLGVTRANAKAFATDASCCSSRLLACPLTARCQVAAQGEPGELASSSRVSANTSLRRIPTGPPPRWMT
jgi:hypothetical protein